LPLFPLSTDRLRRLLTARTVDVITGIRNKIGSLPSRFRRPFDIFNAIRKALGGLTSSEASVALNFWRQASAAGDSFGRLSGNQRQSSRRIPLASGFPSFTGSLEQFLYKTTATYTDPQTGLTKTITVYADNAEPFTTAELMDRVQSGAQRDLAAYVRAMDPTLGVQPDDIVIAVQWVLRKF